jgi:hypothetical protein
MSTQPTLPAAARAQIAALRDVLAGLDLALAGRNGQPPEAAPLAEVLVAVARFSKRLAKLALAAGLAEKKAAAAGQPELFTADGAARS